VEDIEFEMMKLTLISVMIEKKVINIALKNDMNM